LFILRRRLTFASQARFSVLSKELASTASSLQERFAGQYGVIRAKYKGAGFVARLCKACGKGALGEKLRCCAKCKRVYYCCKECQVKDWTAHKPDCETS